MDEIDTAALGELLDKQQLYELEARYCRAVDRADEELLRSCFHPGAIDEHGAPEPIEAHIVYLRDHTLNPAARPNPVQHAITNALFEVDGDVAWGEVYNEVRRIDEGRQWIEGQGRYIDRFERRGGEWRIAHRKVVIDFVASDHYVEGDFLRGSRDRTDPSYR